MSYSIPGLTRTTSELAAYPWSARRGSSSGRDWTDSAIPLTQIFSSGMPAWKYLSISALVCEMPLHTGHTPTCRL